MMVNDTDCLIAVLTFSLCSDPPVDACNIPSGEWLCRRCQAGQVDEGVPLLFKPVVEQACVANPLIFDIPFAYQRNEVLPGKLLLATFLCHTHFPTPDAY